MRSLQEIFAERDFIQAKRSGAKQQIDLAKRTAASGGGHADLEWLSKAEYAYRKMGRTLQALQNEVSLIRQEEKRANSTLSNAQQASFARLFMSNAKKYLAADVYFTLLAATPNDVSEGGEL